MLKKHKMLVEYIAKKETEEGGVGLIEGVKFMKAIWNLADKHWFDAYMKGYPKEVLDYVPTGKTYQIKTVEDIAKLTSEQFEMFVEDLRNFCDIMRWVYAINWMGIETKTNDWMKWIDDGEHKMNVTVTAESTNKI